MRIRLEPRHQIGIVVGIIILILDFLFLFRVGSRWFKPLLAVGIVIGIFQFWLDALNQTKIEREKEEKFLEFVRSLSDSVKSGIPIPKAIIEVSDADYGALSKHVKKLANQISWGIPMKQALNNFSKETENSLIKKSISIVIEAERSGGNITDVLEAITASVLQIKKIKEDRRANTFSQMVQGYFVFFIFVGIMVVLQVFLLPQLGDISGAILTGVGGGVTALAGTQTGASSFLDFNTVFTFLIVIQGFFAGLLIGKFSEDSLKSGLKHSLILMVVGYLIFTTFVGF